MKKAMYEVFVRYKEDDELMVDSHVVECDSIATAASTVTNRMRGQGRIPITMCVHEYGKLHTKEER